MSENNGSRDLMAALRKSVEDIRAATAPRPAVPTDEQRQAAHDLKVWPPYFDALADGSKTFEVRRDDRGFAVGDLLRLREWDPKDTSEGPRHREYIPRGYTGREVTRRVTYVLRDAGLFGVAPGFVVLGLAAGRVEGRAELEAKVEAIADVLTRHEPMYHDGYLTGEPGHFTCGALDEHHEACRWASCAKDDDPGAAHRRHVAAEIARALLADTDGQAGR